MKTQTFQLNGSKNWKPYSPGAIDVHADIVLVFGCNELISDANRIQELSDCFSDATILGCFTACEIYGTTVFDDRLVVMAIKFNSTSVEAGSICIDAVEDSYQAGSRLAY